MNTTTFQADPSAGFPLPDPSVALPRPTGLRRVTDVAEGVLYWGILALGVLMPFLGALYGLARS